MAAKFLLCLPLRLGVLLISFFQFILCGALAGALWWALITSPKDDWATVVHDMKTTTIIVAAVFSAAALVGLLGFLGAIFRKHGFIKTFYILLCLVLSLEIGASIYYLVTFYRKRGQPLDECINGSTDNNIINYCKSIDRFKHVPQAVMIVSFVVPLIVHLYACYVVNAYSKRLQHQRLDKIRESQAFVPPTTTGPSYQPVMRSDETRPLTSQYPYTDATNSFGAHKV